MITRGFFRRFFIFTVFTLFFLKPTGSQADGASRRERLQWAARAEELHREKKYEEAAELFEKATASGASDSDLAQWLPSQGRNYESMGQNQKALASYQRARALRPKDVNRMLDLARIYAQADLNDQAIDLYTQALRRQKNRKDVVLALARLYEKSGHLDLAQKNADRYLKWEPRDTSAQWLMVNIEEKVGRLADAAHRLEGVLAQEPSTDGYFKLGRLWARQNQVELARSAFKKAEGLGLNSASFYFQKGLLAWRSDDLKSAYSLWEETLRRDKNLGMADFFLALCDRQAGRNEMAVVRMRSVASETSSEYMKELAASFLAAVESEKRDHP